MATVVNIAEITRRFQELGWTNLNVADTVNADFWRAETSRPGSS
jgi:hypothetical protein